MNRRWLAVAVVLAGCAKPVVVSHEETLSFGPVSVLSDRTLSLTLTNPSDEPVDVSLSTVDQRFILATPTLQVPANGSASVDVTFTPLGFGGVEAPLLVVSPGGTTKVTMTGRGVGGLVELEEHIFLGRIVHVRGEPTPVIPIPLRVTNVGTPESRLSVLVRVDPFELCVGTDCSVWTTSLAQGESVDVPLTVTPRGFGSFSWTVDVETNAISKSRRTVKVTAIVEEYEPCRLALPDSLVIPAATPARLELMHTGTGTCVVRELTLTSDSNVMRFETEPVLPLTLDANVPKTVSITTLQPRPDTATGNLRVVAGGAVPVDIRLTLERTATTNCLEISPGFFDFGAARLGCASATASFTVNNTCTRPQVIDSVMLSAAAGEGPGGPNCGLTAPCPEFHVVSGVPATTTLQPGASAVFQLRYRPINAGSDTGAVTISSNGLDYIVALQGRADQAARNTDTFRREPLPVADWLMMIDTSPSFAGRRADVRDNVERLLRAPRLECVDLRVRFAPADGAADAGVQFALNDAGSSYTSTREPDFANRALSAFDALPPSSETEACVGPAAQLMAGLAARDGGYSAGFCVTDALEQSPNPTAAYDAFRAGRAPSKASWSTVTGLASSTCSIETADDGVHQSLAQTSLGIRADVCDPNWAASFLPAGSLPCGPRYSFFLTSLPEAVASLVVLIDGQVPPTGAWSYDATMNAVVFVAGQEPQPGSTLTVEYALSCQP